MRILKLCNGFWYLLILGAAGQIAIVLVRWELYAHNWVALVVYLGAPVLLILTSAGILKLVASPQRLNLSLLAFSVVVSVLLIEIYLAFFSHVVNIRTIKMLASGVQIDHRSRKQMIETLRSEGRKAYLTIVPSLLLRKTKENERHSFLSLDNQEILPLGGISSVATVHNPESGQWVVYDSDEYGFRNPAGTWNHDKFDLAVIGDSFAHGAGLVDGGDYASLLRSSFPTSVNLAGGGNGPLIILATVREYCRRLKPRFVVYFYYEGNDLGNLNREKQAPLLMRYLEDESWSQDLYARRNAVNTMLLDFGEKQIRKFYVEIPLVRLRQIFTLSNLRARIGLDLGTKVRKPRKLQPDLALFETILKRFRDEVKAWEGTFVVAYLPAWKRYKNPDTYNVYRREVLNILKTNGIPVVDLHPVFQKQADVFSLFHFGSDGHYNQTGAQLVADEVRKKLELISQ